MSVEDEIRSAAAAATGRTAAGLRFHFDSNGDGVGTLRVEKNDDAEVVVFLDRLRLTKEKERLGVLDRLLEREIIEEADRDRVAEQLLRLGSDTPPQKAPKSPPSLSDAEPWPEQVEGAALLDEIAAWIEKYVWLGKDTIDAIALWVAATYFVDSLYFAPLLALLSPSKRCAKTMLLDLLSQVARRGYPTSGSGITPAVLFRLNEKLKPTFLIDEAEKLNGRNGDRDLIGLLNSGYRRGARVQRCAERGGQIVVDEFDAFGFRALAAIGTLWDTITDRALVVRLVRKPDSALIARFNGRAVEREGAELARRLRRWADDHVDQVEAAEARAPRPAWLNDRACDNWSGLFAVAAVAGGNWSDRAEKAARALAPEGESADRSEELIHDVRRIFDAEGRPEVIRSGELAKKLNALEDAPWSDYRRGQGISMHKQALMLRPFGVRPRHNRPTGGGGDVRGYWLKDLEPVFAQYPDSEVSQLSQPSPDGGPRDLQGVTDLPPCDSSESGMRGGDLGPVTPVTVQDGETGSVDGPPPEIVEALDLLPGVPPGWKAVR